MGVDTKQLLVVQAGYGEEAIDLVDALVRAEDVAIVVVDSMAGLIASKEIAQSVENYDIGTSALLIKRMVNKLMIAFCEEQKRDHDPCVILINQTRFKPGVMFGDPETMPGWRSPEISVQPPSAPECQERHRQGHEHGDVQGNAGDGEEGQGAGAGGEHLNSVCASMPMTICRSGTPTASTW